MRQENGMIYLTEPKEIFVFGSNKEGIHMAGAAYCAWKNYGAVWGQGQGLQGRSYAIPTMRTFKELKDEVKTFIKFANDNQDMTFVVTPIGCGIAGYEPEQIAPLFAEVPDNVILPVEFR